MIDGALYTDTEHRDRISRAKDARAERLEAGESGGAQMTSLEESLKALGIAPKGVAETETKDAKPGNAGTERSPRPATAGELGAACLSDTSTGFPSPFAHAARLDGPSGPPARTPDSEGSDDGPGFNCVNCQDKGCAHCERWRCRECQDWGCLMRGPCDRRGGVGALGPYADRNPDRHWRRCPLAFEGEWARPPRRDEADPRRDEAATSVSGASELMRRYLSTPWRRHRGDQAYGPLRLRTTGSEREPGARVRTPTEGGDCDAGRRVSLEPLSPGTITRIARRRQELIGVRPDQMARLRRSQRGPRRPESEGEQGASSRSRSSAGFGSPYAHAVRLHPRGPSRSRPLRGRCRRQRPGERIRYLMCQRHVGPGCAPGCLLTEFRGVGRERVGFCPDWPLCGDQRRIPWTDAVRMSYDRRRSRQCESAIGSSSSSLLESS